jgi:hypothetical protein
LVLKHRNSYLERERGRGRERLRWIDRERSKLGTSTGNFLSGKRGGERYRLGWLSLG